MKRLAIFGAGLALAGLSGFVWLAREPRVGDVTPEGTFVPTGVSVRPVGITATLSEAAVDAAVLPDGRAALVKGSDDLSLVRLKDGSVAAHVAIPGGASMTGLALSPDGRLAACSTAGSEVVLYRIGGEALTEATRLKLPAAQVGGAAYPCGLAFLDASRLLVAANRDNALLVVNLASGAVERRIPVDPAPYQVQVLGDGRALVSCWAGPLPAGRPSAPSSGTEVEVDARGIGVGGTVCRVDLAAGRMEARASVPRQPTEIAVANGTAYVACANGDAVVGLDPKSLKVRKTLRVGSQAAGAPDSLAVDPKSSRLYVAYGGLDRVAAFDLRHGRLIGLEPTAWYPSVVRIAGDGLLVATAKGVGSRGGTTAKRSVLDVTGTVSFVPDPAFPLGPQDPVADSHPRPDAAPVPVPVRLGEPSVFKHVVYVIKENRTYDQLLGDMKEGDGDPGLTMYGEDVTPNHHALARQFALLDNYYCNGIVSSDGHAWTTEANATTFYERSRGGWTRSYPFGDDPLATSSSGYLWDDALAHGKTVHNFGEFDYATPDPDRKPMDILHAFLAGEPLRFKQNIGVARLRALSERDYPGWNLAIPDVLRSDRFVRHLRESNRLADLTLLYFPEDHTAGGAAGFPSPRAQVADNDLGLGRAIDAISHSPLWPSTVIFVIEDDPQNGFDHVDGHRSVCLVVSPYTRRRAVVSRFYNQTSVVHTIERILGLPPMNRNDAGAPLMTDCFTDTPDLTPYDAVPNRIPLDEPSPPGKRAALRIDKPDVADENLFNRTLWSLARGRDPYPAAFAGAHGKGLAKRGLKPVDVDHDDD